MRVFAVQIDDDLFDAITERVKELGTTKRGYIESLTLKELRESQEAKQTAQSELDQENKENRNQPKMWDAKEVSEAIDSFIEKITEFQHKRSLRMKMDSRHIRRQDGHLKYRRRSI